MTDSEKNAYKWRKAACRWQTLTVAWQFIIVFVFWAFCAVPFIFHSEVPWYWKGGLAIAHTAPFLFTLVNFYITDSQLKLRDFWHSFALGVIYCTINYLYTVSPKTTEPVYPFLPWTNVWMSALACFLCTCVGTIGMLATGYVQERRMGRPFRDSW